MNVELAYPVGGHDFFAWFSWLPQSPEGGTVEMDVDPGCLSVGRPKDPVWNGITAVGESEDLQESSTVGYRCRRRGSRLVVARGMQDFDGTLETNVTHLRRRKRNAVDPSPIARPVVHTFVTR